MAVEKRRLSGFCNSWNTDKGKSFACAGNRKGGYFLYMKEARWWYTEADGRILCTLCPRYCRIGEGQPGFCYIRKNIGGKLYSLG